MEIISLIINILSLIATITVSFAIYWLQKKREDEDTKKEQKYRQLAISEEAKNFLINNEEERDFLPYCIFASSLNRHIRHQRKIYTEFNRCSDELQLEILKKAGFSFGIITKNDWIEECIEAFIRDRDKYKLGKDFLYDNAKYFHSGFFHYRKEQIPDILFNFSIQKPYGLLGKISIGEYIDKYAGKVHGEMESGQKSLNLDYSTPPFDMIWEIENLASFDNEIKCCAWIIHLVSISANIFQERLYKDIIKLKNLDFNTDVQIETIEDLYYDAVKILYLTYVKENRKVER